MANSTLTAGSTISFGGGLAAGGSPNFMAVASTLSIPEVLGGTFNSITLHATGGGLTIGSISASGGIDLNAFGSIVQSNGGLLTGGTISLTADTAVGSLAAPINVQTPSLGGSSGSGGVFCDERGGRIWVRRLQATGMRTCLRR